MSQYYKLTTLTSTKRIEALADGIYAIAMTLLVLSIGVPLINGNVTETVFIQELLGLLPKVGIYALSFWILSLYWRENNRQFFFIQKSDRTLLGINIICLLFIGLVPFSTDLIGEYGHFTIANVVFHLNLLFAALLYYFNWSYATKNKLTNDKLTPEIAIYIRRMNLVLPILALMAIGASFFIHGWSSTVYLLSPLVKKLLPI